MDEIVPVERRSAVLRHPSLPCLARHYTINLTAGCPNRCRYCYARSFRHHPGWGKLLFYANTAELLERELARKRRAPELVFFSTGCEPFVPDDRVLGCLHDVMSLLLGRRVAILVSTKCRVPDEFVALFEQHRDLVHVQVGITTADDDVRRLLEPNAISVPERLANLRNLIVHGIRAEVRMDPLIPGLTDTAASFDALCRVVADSGATQAVASHLFLRRSGSGLDGAAHGAWSGRRMARRLYRHRMEGFCEASTIWLPTRRYRAAKHTELSAIANEHGLRLRFCSCTNPDLTDDVCRPMLPAQPHMQTPLFTS